MRDFDGEMEGLQVRWRLENVDSPEWGAQNGVSRPWILPASRWEDGLWPPLRSGQVHSVPGYLEQHGVHRHTGSHNLKSSWISAANMYFPFGLLEGGRAMLAAFLASQVDDRVRSVESTELEWAATGDLSPSVLLGEEGGSRGSGQTSPDLAFLVNGGMGLVLVENSRPPVHGPPRDAHAGGLLVARRGRAAQRPAARRGQARGRLPGTGQAKPASASREKASETVEFETPSARAMARCESPASNLRRCISLILRMDSLL